MSDSNLTSNHAAASGSTADLEAVVAPALGVTASDVAPQACNLVSPSPSTAATGGLETPRAAASSLAPSAVQPAQCPTCLPAPGTPAAGTAAPALVYALGQLGYDFGSEARRESLRQHAKSKTLQDASHVLAHFDDDPAAAKHVNWTLSLDSTVIYAIAPVGPFAHLVYDQLRKALKAQLTEGVELVSIPGHILGTVTLLNGQTVPRILAEARGIFSWTVPALVQAVLGPAPTDAKALGPYNTQSADLRNFLDRVYYELRNLGTTPQERALNYAATDAFRAGSIFVDAFKSGLKLDRFEVERSPICRPGSDCWDVKLTLFNPLKRLEEARHVYRYTIDVSDVVPVTVGKVRHWEIF